jgi:hypothetical protein
MPDLVASAVGGLRLCHGRPVYPWFVTLGRAVGRSDGRTALRILTVRSPFTSMTRGYDASRNPVEISPRCYPATNGGEGDYDVTRLTGSWPTWWCWSVGCEATGVPCPAGKRKPRPRGGGSATATNWCWPQSIRPEGSRRSWPARVRTCQRRGSRMSSPRTTPRGRQSMSGLPGSAASAGSLYFSRSFAIVPSSRSCSMFSSMAGPSDEFFRLVKKLV